MNIAALYARVSTKNQEDEKTILSQIAEIEQKAKDEGYIIDEQMKFIDDGWSGELLERPALDDLRYSAKKGSFQILYLYDLGRLSRNFLNQLILKTELDEAGVKLISLHDINAESPETKFAQNVMGLFHDFERIKIADRFRRGKLYKAKSGILFGWEAPYGYRYIKGNQKGAGVFKIHPSESETVKKIFEWVGIEGLTIRQVIKRLYDQKTYPRDSVNKYWSTSTLSKRLRDTTYIGTTYYNKTLSIVPQKPYKDERYKKIKKSSRKANSENEWLAIDVPSIIDKELFEKTQQQLAINNRLSIRNRKYDYLLSGVIACTCGCTRAGEGSSHSGHHYYRCTDRVRRFPLPKVCDKAGVNVGVIDPLVWKQISKLLTSPKLVEEQAKKWLRKQNRKSVTTQYYAEKVKTQLAQIAKEEKRYLKAYGEGIISFEQYKEQNDDIKLKKAQLLSDLHKANDTSLSPSHNIELPDTKELCGKIAVILKKANFEKKQFIIRRIVDKVTTDGKTAVVKGYLPLSVNELESNNVKYKSIYRNRRTSKCWQKYTL